MTAYARLEPRSGETDAAYAAVARLVRRAEGAASWARFARITAETYERWTGDMGKAADWERRAEDAEARAAHLKALAVASAATERSDVRALACEAGAVNERGAR